MQFTNNFFTDLKNQTQFRSKNSMQIFYTWYKIMLLWTWCIFVISSHSIREVVCINKQISSSYMHKMINNVPVSEIYYAIYNHLWCEMSQFHYTIWFHIISIMTRHFFYGVIKAHCASIVKIFYRLFCYVLTIMVSSNILY